MTKVEIKCEISLMLEPCSSTAESQCMVLESLPYDSVFSWKISDMVSKAGFYSHSLQKTGLVYSKSMGPNGIMSCRTIVAGHVMSHGQDACGSVTVQLIHCCFHRKWQVDVISSENDAQVDLALEARHLWQFNYNFRHQRHVRFPFPIYPLVAPEVLVETYEEGEGISRYVAEEGRSAFKSR